VGGIGRRKKKTCLSERNDRDGGGGEAKLKTSRNKRGVEVGPWARAEMRKGRRKEKYQRKGGREAMGGSKNMFAGEIQDRNIGQGRSKMRPFEKKKERVFGGDNNLREDKPKKKVKWGGKIP